MNFVVLPASGVPHSKSTTTIAAIVNGVLAMLVCMGLTGIGLDFSVSAASPSK
jgi:hypothetical protein